MSISLNISVSCPTTDPDGVYLPKGNRARNLTTSTTTSGSVVHTDGWLGYEPLQARGYIHQVTFLRGHEKSPSELLPRVHRVIALLKRWLLGTHQGAIGQDHLDDYLNEFSFRFNRRTSASRGKLFYRLAQQAVQVDPVPFASLVNPQPIAFGGVR